ncbi:MAG: imidazole glycerol phosphate synthase subunit HisH [Rhodospirillaceae bacterium]|nr:imidazole glycerol phosphate synthase subunit HisH [Rhodospirillaceae bacterium]MDD9917265.1 imidazole glycerol phosphate synthase subunit HisH [Rhodospirillaceae bacterium]MDD9929664.1 imidazole glycerol phosphate synthase subunit HisH [Rhodospirillaceae bacterium]
MITIVDYGRGNLFSISQALHKLGAEHRVSADPSEIERAQGIVLPGVGAFGDAMAALERGDLVAPLRAAAESGTPVLGICLGMQLLADASSEFGAHRGLGLIPGTVDRLPAGAMRVPNVGWRALRWRQPDRLAARDLSSDSMVYFVHSYGFNAACADDVVADTMFNDATPAAIVKRGAIMGMQFHPEKSAETGLALIDSFLNSLVSP